MRSRGRGSSLPEYDPGRIKTGWRDTMGDLEALFSMWGITQWQVRPMREPDHRSHWATDKARVEIDYERKGVQVHVEIDKHPYYYQNLRVLYMALKAARENQMRGLDDVMTQIYGMLPSPAVDRNPYEVLGVREGAPREVIEGAYKALAHKHHPDRGGDASLMAGINAAWERIKQNAPTQR